MVKLFALTFGCGLALGLAACAAPAAEQTPAETTQVEQVKPETRPRDGERRAPPEMAYTACADLAEAASCSVETPRGTLNGVCQTSEGESRAFCFVQRPEGGPRERGGERPDRPRPSGE